MYNDSERFESFFQVAATLLLQLAEDSEALRSHSIEAESLSHWRLHFAQLEAKARTETQASKKARVEAEAMAEGDESDEHGDTALGEPGVGNFHVGSRVEGLYKNGQWYEAKIVGTLGKKFILAWSDGDGEDTIKSRDELCLITSWTEKMEAALTLCSLANNRKRKRQSRRKHLCT